MTSERIAETEKFLKEDEERRNRDAFLYSHDLLTPVDGDILHQPIWPMPNSEVSALVLGDITSDEIERDGDNDFLKELRLPDQRQFIADHGGETPLCEALGYKPCRRWGCPLYVLPGDQGGEFGLCSEFKIAFSIDP